MSKKGMEFIADFLIAVIIVSLVVGFFAYASYDKANSTRTITGESEDRGVEFMLLNFLRSPSDNDHRITKGQLISLHAQSLSEGNREKYQSQYFSQLFDFAQTLAAEQVKKDWAFVLLDNDLERIEESCVGLKKLCNELKGTRKLFSEKFQYEFHKQNHIHVMQLSHPYSTESVYLAFVYKRDTLW